MPAQAFHALGETLTKALITGDFGLYRSVLSLPMTFTPKYDKPYTLPDEAALRTDFDLYASTLQVHRVTDIYRQVLGFDQLDDGRVWVRLTTHILVSATLLVEPFPTRMLLRRDSDGWRIVEIESSLGHLNWTLGRATVSDSGGFEAKETEG